MSDRLEWRRKPREKKFGESRARLSHKMNRRGVVPKTRECFPCRLRKYCGCNCFRFGSAFPIRSPRRCLRQRRYTKAHRNWLHFTIDAVERTLYKSAVFGGKQAWISCFSTQSTGLWCQFDCWETAYHRLKKRENHLYTLFACANLYYACHCRAKLSTV